MTIGQRLREERESLGLSQPKFAALAGTTKQTLFSWESNKTAPDADQLAAFAAAGVDVLYVLTGVRHQPERLPDIEWVEIHSEDKSPPQWAKVMGYDRRTGQVLIPVRLSDEPQVELLLKSELVPHVVKDDQLYAPSSWLAEHFPKHRELYELISKRVMQHFAPTTQSASRSNPKAQALLDNFLSLSDEDQNALSRLADSLAKSEKVKSRSA